MNEEKKPAKWVPDAGFIDIDLIGDLLYRTRLIDSFLEEDNKLFLSANKGMGKTLLMTYKRLQIQKSHPSALIIPQGKPFLDNMTVLADITVKTQNAVADNKVACRLWMFCIEFSIISYIQPELNPHDLAILDGPLQELRRILEERQKINPTQIMRMLLEMSTSNMLKILPAERFFEKACKNVTQEVRVFIDKVDQALQEMPQKTWIVMQGALLEAAYNLYTGNNHIKVYCTIRQEAYSNYPSEIKTNLQGATVLIKYTRRELIQVVDKLTQFYEKSKLDDFIGKDKVVKTLLRVEENAIDLIIRHTLHRPRDIVSILSALTFDPERRDMDRFKQIVVDVANEQIIPNVITESLVFLDSLRDQEKRHKFLSTLKTNIMNYEEVLDVYAEFNEIDRNLLGQIGINNPSYHHPFSELYKVGLLGIIDEEGVIRFKMPNDFQDFQSVKIPKTEDYYLIHPAFSRYIQAFGNANYRGYRFIIPGHDLPWNRQLYELLISIQRLVFKIGDPTIQDEMFNFIESNYPFIKEHKCLPNSDAVASLMEKLDSIIQHDEEDKKVEAAISLFILLEETKKSKKVVQATNNDQHKIYNPVGEWDLLEQYEFGRTSGVLVISKKNDSFEGIIRISDTMNQGISFVVEEKLEVSVSGRQIILKGMESKIVQGDIKNYYLDKWEGEFINEEIIVGNSMDEKATSGTFTCQKRRKGNVPVNSVQ